ncbi:helicase/UvrB domain-containing protein (plasmid) [Rhizobium gallicum]|uniref:Helicase/UvrB domain-containing protein n=1 Tax=Rhizobium gallicum TaxID=56730 RepID=A0A1L5NQ76_9HYPH|nr:DEAD/DEAH box helicase family protein [Rhizobium gallicum]APO70065.1 helicase/UvrB domain-containing protein [Rhizobium gallicum]
MTQSCFEAMSEAMSIRLEHRDETGKVSHAGLRKTQLAAAYAGAAHALHSQEAATIAMPTGTGKSAVMILVSALVKARRVLVIVASARLREELAEKFSEVDPFRRLEMLKSKIAPRVRRVYNRITDEAGWRALDEADVVVGLPQTLSPAYKSVCPPPSGFFDLALIDEGHHAPAETWRKLIEDLGPIPKILFSATPYRLDRRRMPGPIIHTYSARAAYKDGVFGKIVYHAVAPGGGETPDQAICRATLATKLLAPFNVGLRTRQYGDGAESYRSSAGRAAGDAFGAMEAVRYVRGHLAAKIDDDEILGMSESSKLWGGQNVSVQEFAKWCERLGAAIRSDSDPRGRRGYFGVPFVVPLREIPARVVAADWPLDVYSKPLTLVRVSEVSVASTRLQDSPDEVSSVPSPLSLLLDCAIEIASRPQPSDQMSLRIRWASGYTTVSYQPGARPVFRATERKSGTGFVPTDQLLVRRGGNYEKFLDFINAQPPTLYSIDGAIIVGAEGTEPLAELPLVPSEETFVEKIWPATVDIRRERLSDEFPHRIESIQDEIARELIFEGFDVVFHDDGSGELADLITIRQIASEGLLQDIEITLWHAKYSGSDDPGRRLQDQYEVLGQAIKSGRRLTYSAVRAHIDRRHQKGGDHKFLAGDIDMMRLLLSGDAMQKYLYRIKVVQPGTSISKVSADIKQVVAAAAHLIEYGGLNRFEYIASP